MTMTVFAKGGKPAFEEKLSWSQVMDTKNHHPKSPLA
jgi:hypothetical protein